MNVVNGLSSNGKSVYFIPYYSVVLLLAPQSINPRELGGKNGSGSGFVECVVGTEIGSENPVRTGWWGEAPPNRLTIMMIITMPEAWKFHDGMVDSNGTDRDKVSPE